MKKAISYLKSLMNFSGHSDGAKEQPSTSVRSQGESPSAKFKDPILVKLNEVLKEREKLQKEIESLQEKIQLLQRSLNKHYDV